MIDGLLLLGQLPGINRREIQSKKLKLFIFGKNSENSCLTYLITPKINIATLGKSSFSRYESREVRGHTYERSVTSGVFQL